VGTKIAKKTAIFPTGLDLKFISHKGGVLALYGNMDPPVEKIAEKAACRSVFSTTWHCILSASAELTKTHSFRQFFWRICPLVINLRFPQRP